MRTSTRARSPIHAAAVLAVALVLTLGLAGCGDEAETPSGDPGGSGAAPSVAAEPLAGREGKSVLELLPGDARTVLEEADRLELLALHPYPFDDDGKPTADAGFHDYKVLGRAEVPAADRRGLIEALYRGVNENDDTVASCFNPRHGLRAVKGARTVDIVICFECLQLFAVGADPAERTQGLTSDSPQPVFDALLAKLGLPKHRDE